MKTKLVVSLVAAAFVIGILLGATGGGSFVLWKVLRFEADAIVSAVAENTFGLVPVVIALGTEDEEERLIRFESAARLQMSAGVLAIHNNLPMLSDERRKQMEEILRSMARNREKLAIGRFNSPPMDHVEDILVSYSN